MLVRFLKYNSTAGYLFFVLLTFISWLPGLLSETQTLPGFDHIPMPLYSLVAGYISTNVLFSKIIAIVIVIFCGFYLIRLNIKYSLLKERAILPALIFILIVSSLTVLHRQHPMLFAMIFLLPAIEKLLESYKTEGLSYNYFEASFLIGAGSLFYFNLIYFIVIVWVALLIFRPVIWREWALSLIGVVTPWFFFIIVDFFINESVDQIIELVINNLTSSNQHMFILLPEKIFFSVLLLLIILASRKIIISMAKMRVLTRKIYVLLFWIFSLGLLIYSVIETANVEWIFPVAIPVSLLLSNYLLALKSGFWSNFILWSLIIMVQVVIWIPLLL